MGGAEAGREEGASTRRGRRGGEGGEVGGVGGLVVEGVLHKEHVGGDCLQETNLEFIKRCNIQVH